MVSGNALLEEPVEQLQSEVVIAVVYAEAGYWRLVNSREPVENSRVGSVYALAPEPELEPGPEMQSVVEYWLVQSYIWLQMMALPEERL